MKGKEVKKEVKARLFNSIEVDVIRGILRKTSENKKKLIDEINWYLKLPDDLQCFTPRIYRYSLNIEAPYIEMEYYGYKTLHEMMVWGNLSEKQWERYFQSLKFIVKAMKCYKCIGNEKDFNNALNKIYVNKTLTRIALLQYNSNFENFFEEPIVINGVRFKDFNSYIKILPDIVNEVLIKNWKGEFNIIHGDLCFTNVLVEETCGFMRLIDPRGSFGDFDIYGDFRYELAKLLHSIEGGYDFIIEDMFTLETCGNSISFSIQQKEKHVIKAFEKVFSDELIDKRELHLIEAILFLSMIPLHADYISRQIVMFATGIQLLDEVISKGESNHEE